MERQIEENVCDTSFHNVLPSTHIISVHEEKYPYKYNLCDSSFLVMTHLNIRAGTGQFIKEKNCQELHL